MKNYKKNHILASNQDQDQDNHQSTLSSSSAAEEGERVWHRDRTSKRDQEPKDVQSIW